MISLEEIVIQKKESPAYPEMLWSKPENKNYAGSMLLIGGNSEGFNNLSDGFALLNKEVIKAVNVATVDSLKKKIGQFLTSAHYLPSNPSGGFANNALDELSYLSNINDYVLLIGDLGGSSETEMLIENLINDQKQNITIANDGIDIFLNTAAHTIERGKLNLVIEFNKLQKLLIKLKITKALTSDTTLLGIAEILSELTKSFDISIITDFNNQILYSFNSRVGLIKADFVINKLAIKSATWLMQNPEKQFEAISCALFELL